MERATYFLRLYRILPFRTFMLGDATRHELRRRIRFELTDYAAFLLKQEGFPLVETPTEVETAAVALADLGFRHPSTSWDVLMGSALDPVWLARWSARNWRRLPPDRALALLPLEAGPQIRYQYQDQPKEESLWVATATPVGETGFPSLFAVEHLECRLDKNHSRFQRWLSAYPLAWKDPRRTPPADPRFLVASPEVRLVYGLVPRGRPAHRPIRRPTRGGRPSSSASAA